MKVLLAVAVSAAMSPAAVAVSPRATVITANFSATVDVTLSGATTGPRLRDVRLTGDRATTAFFQRLPDLTLVATLVGADGPHAARVGPGSFPDGRYRVTIITPTPASLSIATSRSRTLKAVRRVIGESRVTTSSAIAPANRITQPVRTRRGSLYAFVVTTTQTGAAGAHVVCLRTDGACLVHGPSNVTTWRATSAAPSRVRTSLVGVADGSYTSFECDVLTAGVATGAEVIVAFTR